jgi:hypothetical protein
MTIKALRSRTTGLRIAAVGTAVAAVAIAASTALASHLMSSSNDPVGQAVASQAKELVAYHTSLGQVVSAWSAPTADGRQCGFFQSDSAQTASPVFHPNNGGFCRLDSGPASISPGQDPFASMTEWLARPGGGYSPLVEGAAVDGSGITSVRIDGPAGPLSTVSSKDGYFIAELPVTSTRDLPPGGDYYITGYNAAGTLVARVDLNQLIAQGRP